MSTYVFPGQGSQIIGMGGSLFNEFDSYVQQANVILGYDIAELCLQDPNKCLNNTQYTQPALYTVNALSYLKKLQETPDKPKFVAGHSLGEYNACFAAGVFDFEAGLKLVKKRGELMSTIQGGGMAAVIGLNKEQIVSVLQQNQLDTLSIANYNSYTQIVISGPSKDIGLAENHFIAAGANLYIPLNTSGAFHSTYMQDAAQTFSQYIQQFRFSTPEISIITNVNARPCSTSEIAINLVNQITHSVNWTQSIQYLLEVGETEFVEVGPQKVLTRLIQNIRKGL